MTELCARSQINDGLNSVARMRRGAIEDFYLQAVISFMVSFIYFGCILSSSSHNLALTRSENVT
jgi:hypothetical protein